MFRTIGIILIAGISVIPILENSKLNMQPGHWKEGPHARLSIGESQ